MGFAVGLNEGVSDGSYVGTAEGTYVGAEEVVDGTNEGVLGTTGGEYDGVIHYSVCS